MKEDQQKSQNVKLKVFTTATWRSNFYTSVYSIFTKPDPSSTESTFRWDTPFGEKKTCLHGINLSPKISPKIAAFDLDGCLIESSFGFKAKGTQHSVKLWRNSVPTKLKEALSSGWVVVPEVICMYLSPLIRFSIVIITNQALRGQNAILEWKKKIPIFSKLVCQSHTYRDHRLIFLHQ